MEQNIVVEFLFAEWPSHVDVCKQDGRIGIKSYPLRQRYLVALGGVSASVRSSERGASDRERARVDKLTSSLASDA